MVCVHLTSNLKVKIINKKIRMCFDVISISGDTGFYTCTGTNHLGSVATSAELVVNNENWGIRK